MNVVTGEVPHDLGALGATVGAAVYLALVWAGWRRERVVRGRGAVLLALDAGGRGRWWGRVGWMGLTGDRSRLRRWAAPLGALAAGWILVGGVLGCVTGLAAAYGTWRRLRFRPKPRPDAPGEDSVQSSRQLPLAADLLAACIAAGAGPRDAAEAVGESMGGPVGDRLARAAAEIRLGGEPSLAWGRFGDMPGAGPLARCLYRAGATGAPAAEPVARLAETIRAERAGAAVARAQRAGVLITAPVGLCFLPAFLAVGVAPVVIGLAAGLAGGG
ncbi:type II secretion system F family protein [Streptomyces sp. NBC_01433]|uniref:type II secretion system F family protein n=1 Tax=Streptomyces sp. NBC_01433 TaxID=2903864 RepID=UPI00224E68B1|nr:type II secretion system F family protein [Streptomyces sp. NBC_01433]MCX4676153.1 type II secretion system F family protein [Streptomyces sp. NBC_01433]